MTPWQPLLDLALYFAIALGVVGILLAGFAVPLEDWRLARRLRRTTGAAGATAHNGWRGHNPLGPCCSNTRATVGLFVVVGGALWLIPVWVIVSTCAAISALVVVGRLADRYGWFGQDRINARLHRPTFVDEIHSAQVDERPDDGTFRTSGTVVQPPFRSGR